MHLMQWLKHALIGCTLFFSVDFAAASKPLLTAFYYPGRHILHDKDLSQNQTALAHLNILIYSASIDSLRPSGHNDFRLASITKHNLTFIANWLKSHHLKTKLMLSLGLWHPKAMRRAITDSNTRQQFVMRIKQTLNDKSLGLSGIDLDWENVYSPVKHEIERFPLLLQDLHQALKGSNKLISVDLPSNFIEHFPKPKQWINYVDWANLMAYEYYGDRRSHAELDGTFGRIDIPYAEYTPKYPMITLNTVLQRYRKLGIDNQKMVVILPLYGASNRVTHTDKAHHYGIHQHVIGSHDIKVIPYWKIVARMGTTGHTKNGYTAHCYNHGNGFSSYWLTRGQEFITYPDPIATKQITTYLYNHNYRGISVWELSDAVDYKSHYSQLKLIYEQL